MTVISDMNKQTGSNNNSERESKTQGESFYPLALSLSGKAVLVFGGNQVACTEILRLAEAGANLVVTAGGFIAEIQELQVAYGSRIELVRLGADKFLRQQTTLSRFSLIFSFLDDREINGLIASLACSSAVPLFCEHELEHSAFVTASVLKRGHVKIAVSTDGICAPMETALINRIEELLINDFDRHSLFVAAVEERFKADSELKSLANQSEEFLAALSRNNFDQALKTLDHLKDLASEETV